MRIFGKSEKQLICLQLCFSERQKNPHETFHNSKKNCILKTNAHSEIHFENERVFSVYNCVFRKDEKKPHETFHISKKKLHFEI